MAGNSTYEPFLRRAFAGPEYDRDLTDIWQLYMEVDAQHKEFEDERLGAQSSDRNSDMAIGLSFMESFRFTRLPDHLGDALRHVLSCLVAHEDCLFQIQRPDLERMSFDDLTSLRARLYQKRHFLHNRRYLIPPLTDGLSAIYDQVVERAPPDYDDSPFSIPFVHSIRDAKRLIQELIFIVKATAERGLMEDAHRQLWQNLIAASRQERNGNLLYPTQSQLPLDMIVRVYLRETPFEDLFTAPVPLKLTQEQRFNHMHVLGGSGAGKTTLIENLLFHDIKSSQPPSVVIVDPHGDLIQKLLRADIGIDDRLIYINPRDVEHSPQLNVFAINRARMSSYDATTREQVTAGVIETFDYFFTGLLGADLTAKQSLPFRMMARLLLTFPETMGRNATVIDMLRLVQDASPYQQAIQALGDFHREFFERDFLRKDGPYRQTKEQIRYRLQGILENPTIFRLLTAPNTKVDIFSALNNPRGSVVIVDCAKDFLKQEGAAILGKMFIALTLQAVEERAAIPECERKPTFLIVDEAASFFSSSIDELLTSARKYKCGCLLSHQYLDQAANSLRASLAANTGIKCVSGVSANDARAIAPELRTNADFILSQPRLSFATYIRGVTREAISLPVQPLGRIPQLSPSAFEMRLLRNQDRVWEQPVAVPELDSYFVPVQSSPAGSLEGEPRTSQEAASGVAAASSRQKKSEDW